MPKLVYDQGTFLKKLSEIEKVPQSEVDELERSGRALQMIVDEVYITTAMFKSIKIRDIYNAVDIIQEIEEEYSDEDIKLNKGTQFDNMREIERKKLFLMKIKKVKVLDTTDLF